MIKYLQVKVRTRGGAEIYYREKVNTRANCSKEQYIKKTKSVLITGQADSGKTRNLTKIWDKRAIIWQKKKFIYFDSIMPLTQWLDQEQKYTTKSGLKQWQKVKELEKFCKDNKPIVFIDNCHKLTGRKLDIAKNCSFKNIVYATAIAENKIPPTIRQIITHNGERFNLGTSASFDGTLGLIIILSLLAFMFGYSEIGVLIGVLAMLRGR